jgi:carbonic anhydrase
MSVYEEFLTANEQYASGFDRDGDGGKPMPPARKVVVITCMDARLDPAAFLGLGIGDAHVIRNAGGRVSEDAIRSVVISERFLGTTEIVVIHHTDCGMLTFTNADLAGKIREDLGVDVGDRDFLPFPDLERSVRDDVATLKDSPLIPKDIAVSGAIYDVRTGLLTTIA